MSRSRAFTLRRVGLQGIRRAALEWDHGSYRVPSWVRSPLADPLFPGERTGVAIRLLDTSHDLKQEGLAMRHCVGHCASEHALGEAVYFSLTEMASGQRATLSVVCCPDRRCWVMDDVKAADNEAVPAQSPIHQVAYWLVDRIAPGKGPIEMRVRDAAKMAERLGTHEWLSHCLDARDI